EIGHRPAGMAEDEADIGEARGGALEDEACDRARRVRAVFDDRIREKRLQPGAAEGRRRMDEDQRAAAVELLEDGLEARLAEIVPVIARIKADAVDFELVQSKGDLIKARRDRRQRQRGEKAEALRPVR